ncbi:site-specific integrase [Streptomyces sp. Isolate_45]|uniref:tyrosine-type recombinase/integrase n=1 Tax=Streptomyces sp. Isolate_45 TaxID=2950111 RepID=UPI002481B28E|nr:site-specific integrase [Streptomyces sp. Isolate_45]MDA5283889.1 site-specific integrase [Streptomyces sp. Isolate_45]
MAEVLTLGPQRGGGSGPADQRAYFFDTLAEYQWARDAAGLMPATIDQLVKPVVEVCDHYGLVPWELTPRHVDQYFAGPGKRARGTVRAKINNIDGYFAFLEQRFAGEISRRFGALVESPVDPFNRPRHRGDFGLRIPPSQKAMRDFFAAWRDALPQARKWAVACRDYVMAKLAYLSGVRAAELCGVGMADVHWEAGQWGRFVVQGKGARGSGPRPREAFMFEQGRELLWWYVEEVRGHFRDDPEHPLAALFPSERLPRPVEDLNMPIAPAIVPATFRRALQTASRLYLPEPVPELFPHLLRHACATHNYERGMSLWEVQRLLGHTWTTTTVRYVASAQADPELGFREASERAAQRLEWDKGSLR